MKTIMMTCAAVVALGALADATTDRRLFRQEDLDNISYRTINGQSIVGEGNIEVSGGEDYMVAQDVTKFGAVGDGVTDDTAAVKAAMAAGKSVLFPHNDGSDTYLVSETLVLGDGVTFKGAPNVTLKAPGVVLHASGKDVTVQNINLQSGEGDVALVSGENVRFRNVHVDCDSANTKVGGLVVSNATYVLIEDGNLLYTKADGLKIIGTSANVVVRNEAFTGNKSTGLSIGPDVRGVIVDGCQFSSNPTGLTGFGDDLTIANNTFLYCTSYGVRISGAQRATVSGNAFARCSGSVTTFCAEGSTDGILANNTFGKYGTSGGYTGTNAIYVEHGTNWVIRGNAIDKTYDSEKPVTTATGTVNLTVSNSKNAQITANVSTQGALDIATGNEGVTATSNIFAE